MKEEKEVEDLNDGEKHPHADIPVGNLPNGDVE